jgi:murein L,D-transpeptidase YafK
MPDLPRRNEPSNPRRQDGADTGPDSGRPSGTQIFHRARPKRRGRQISEGDHATPLGEFYICAKNPRSKYFLSLCISYPNAEDAKRGLAENLIDADEYGQIMEALHIGTMPPQHTRLGGEIYIHGREVKDAETASSENDWTRGCIALDNSDMQDLYHRIDIGTPIRIDP